MAAHSGCFYYCGATDCDAPQRPYMPKVDVHGPVARHDYPCPVLWDEHAVLDLNRAVFRPSWKAQELGWQLVQARTWWQRAILRYAFSASSASP